MKYPIMYLSGFTNSTHEKLMLTRSNCKHRCYSAAYVIPGNVYFDNGSAKALIEAEKLGTGIMLDSGAASFHTMLRASASRGSRAKKKQDMDAETLQQEMYAKYTAYVKNKLHEKTLDFYVTLDFKKYQPTIYAMQKKFAKDGLTPVPVFHGDASLDYLNKYADMGVKLIGLGSLVDVRSTFAKKRFYNDSVFNRCAKLGIGVHGLGVGRIHYFFRYPYKSVDHASWTKGAGFGHVMIPTSAGRLVMFHVSDKRSVSSNVASYESASPSQRRALRDKMSEFGFDLQEARKSCFERQCWNAFVFCNLEKFNLSPELGEERQVRWESLL